MEAEFSIDRRTALLRVMVRGTVEVAGLIHLGTRTAEVNTKLQPKSIVYDFTAVTAVDLRTPDVDSLANLRPVIAHDVTQVILAPQDYLYGVARMFQAMAADTRPNVQVGRTWQDAQRLLALTEPPEFEHVES